MRLPHLAVSVRRRASLLAGVALLFLAAPVRAQGNDGSPPVLSALATRQELERAAADFEARATAARGDERERYARAAEAARTRLRDGDFDVGERMLVQFDSLGTVTSDTALVREGKTIQLRGLPPVSLQGVLRSEVQDYLTKQYARFFRNPSVKVIPHVRIAVYGPVATPGFHDFPYDAMLSDVIMLAGGPTQGSDMNKTTILRGKRKIADERDVQLALMRGMTLDQLNVRAGDAIVVGSASQQRNWVEVLRAVGIGVGVLLTLYTLSRRL